jgi:hypothetical protein
MSSPVVAQPPYVVHLDVSVDNILNSGKIKIEELRLASSGLTEANFKQRASQWMKVHGQLLSTKKNTHGFVIAPEGLEFCATDFAATREKSNRHQFFQNHDYFNVESQLGRVIGLDYDSKKKVLNYGSLGDLRHKTVQRIDAFKNVSATIGIPEWHCSLCDTVNFRCEHRPNGADVFPVAKKLVHLETSVVTLPAYDDTTLEAGASFQKQSLEAAMHVFSNDIRQHVTPVDAGVPLPASQPFQAVNAGTMGLTVGDTANAGGFYFGTGVSLDSGGYGSFSAGPPAAGTPPEKTESNELNPDELRELLKLAEDTQEQVERAKTLGLL